MKKIIFLLNLLVFNCYATPGYDHVLLAAAHSQGAAMFSACYPLPIDPHQIAACSAMYLAYYIALQALVAPFPVTPSAYPDPYSPNPFSICRYEVEHFVFAPEFGSPVCPTI